MNPFVPNAPFLYPVKTSENLTVFWYFQGVEKWCMVTNGLLNINNCCTDFIKLAGWLIIRGGNWLDENFSRWESSVWELSGWQFSGWEFSWVGVVRVGIVQVGLILGGNFLWRKCSGWELPGGNHPGGNFPGGSFHVTTRRSHFDYYLAFINKKGRKMS